MRVCIFGAGSVGVHYARAWSKLGSSVDVFDISPDALRRFQNQIWPERYRGPMPPTINLQRLEDLKPDSRAYDLTIIGTPPPSHAQLTEMAIRNNLSKFVSVQKPIAIPSKEAIRNFLEIEELARITGTTLLSGYNHRYSKAFQALLRGLSNPNWTTGEPISIEVNWRESWDGIMKAHPWLRSPSDSYLGYWSRGGGALFEHSHGLDLGLFIWQRLAHHPPQDLRAEIKWSLDGLYDEDSTVILASENLTLRVRQDVVSLPADKSVVVRGGSGHLRVEFSSHEDSIEEERLGDIVSESFQKSRETDFDEEAELVGGIIAGTAASSYAGELTDFSQALGVTILGASAIHKALGDEISSKNLLGAWVNRQSSRLI